MREDGFAFVSLFRLFFTGQYQLKQVYQGNKILGLVIPSQERDLNINGEIVAEIIGLLPDNLNVNNNLWMKKKTRSKKVLIFPQEKIAHDDRKSLLKVRCATTVKPDRTTPGQRLVED